MRKIATVRQITGVRPIAGKDRIVQYVLDGWLVIDQKDRYQTGDLIVYCEPDAWMPNALAPFLSRDREPKVYLEVKGEKLKTIKMGGAISQGLILALDVLTPFMDGQALEEGLDVSEMLGIVKWEAPAPQQANTKGNFPAFIPKTDQERCQNLVKQLGQRLPDELFQVTEKLEGQSFTAYFHQGVFGVCSRNLELKLDEDSVWAQTAATYDLQAKLTAYGKSIAIQGEQVGLGVQGNIYNLSTVRLYVFNIFDISTQTYLSPTETQALTEELGLLHVPVVATMSMRDIGSIDNILAMVYRKSELAPVVAEGLVFKSLSSSFSFKGVSNEYLLSDNKAIPWKS